MIDYILFRYRLWNLRREKESVESDLHDNKPNQELFEELRSKLDGIDDRKRFLLHQYTCKEAEKYLIPIPEYEENSPDWEFWKTYNNRVRLTETKLAGIRAEIKKERNDFYDKVFKILAVLIGLIGAMTGFLAMLR